jgi:metal-responsive CopG/Arc/MetJ family transcriptional regulator
MRTTIQLDPDVERAVDQLRRERGLGVSEAINELIRRGLIERRPAKAFRQRSQPLGMKIDVSNVAEALETLEGVEAR